MKKSFVFHMEGLPHAEVFMLYLFFLTQVTSEKLQKDATFGGRIGIYFDAQCYRDLQHIMLLLSKIKCNKMRLRNGKKKSFLFNRVWLFSAYVLWFFNGNVV